jgi:hypothetical protein
MTIETANNKTKQEFEVEGYVFGFQPHEEILFDMTIHEDELTACINDYIMESREYAEEMTEGQDYDIEEYPPKKVRVRVTIELEEIR